MIKRADDSMNDEEIMKKFNETFAEQPVNQNNEEPVNVTPYKATTNLNTNSTDYINNANNSISSSSQSEQKLNVNDLLSTDTNAYYNPINNVNNSVNTNGISNENVNKNNNNQYQNNVNYNYVPTYTDNKSKKKTVKLSKENIIFLVIVVILFIFIMVIPSIYDVIRQIKMI